MEIGPSIHIAPKTGLAGSLANVGGTLLATKRTTKPELSIVQNDEDEESSFIGADRGTTGAGSRAARRREARDTAKVLAKAKGQGALSVEELLGETVPVDVLGDGRLLVYFYINRFTAKVMRPVEDAELELNRMGLLQAELMKMAAIAKKEKRDIRPEDIPTIEVNITASDLTDAYITALLGPPDAPQEALIASWTLTYLGAPAPLERRFMQEVLGANIVGLIIKRIRDRWKPGEVKGVASA